MKRNQGIALEPMDYDLCGDMVVAFQMGKLDFDPPPSLGTIRIDGGRLAMRFTASPESMSRIRERKDTVEACFHLLVNAHHCAFLRREVP